MPCGDLEMLLQQHPMMSSGMGRAPSFGMAKLESMELPDAVAAVVRMHSCISASSVWLCISAGSQAHFCAHGEYAHANVYVCMSVTELHGFCRQCCTTWARRHVRRRRHRPRWQTCSAQTAAWRACRASTTRWGMLSRTSWTRWPTSGRSSTPRSPSLNPSAEIFLGSCRSASLGSAHRGIGGSRKTAGYGLFLAHVSPLGALLCTSTCLQGSDDADQVKP